MMAERLHPAVERSASAFAAAASGRLLGSDAIFREVVSDSRAIGEGDCFVALSGPNFDGHDFVAQAAGRGAACAVVSRAVDVALPQIVVDDPLQALQAFAAHWRAAFDIPLVGVTGSNGKTTVRALLEAVLAPLGPVLATRGNLNNHIGVPLTLCRLRGEHRAAVIEMGANHAGEIAMLSAMARPTLAIVSNAGDAHLEGFGSRDGVARAKGEIFAALPAKGVAVINADDAYADYWRSIAQCRQLGFGLHADADVRASAVRPEPPEAPVGNRFQLHIPGADAVEVQLPLPGEHNVRNALAAAAAAHALGLDAPRIALALRDVTPPEGRLRWHQLAGGARLLDDSYNANPDSLAAGVALLAATRGTRVLALGDMAELGPNSRELHAEAGARARAAGIERVYGVGPLAREAVTAFGEGGEAFDSTEALIEAMRRALAPDWVVLLKGSRTARMEQVLAGLAAAERGEG